MSGIVTPDTILRWYRELIAAKYDGTARRGAGHPGTASSLRELVVRLASENPTWGYTRIRDVLASLGHVLGRNTVKRILLEHGLEPAPSRGGRMPWSTFLKAHLGSIAATDFFTVEALTLTGLVRYYALFVVDIETRRVQIAGIVRQPHGAWMSRSLATSPTTSMGSSRASATSSTIAIRCSPTSSESFFEGLA
jgi:hypothetical protein